MTKIPPPARTPLRSRLAMVGAAVVGIAALVITPKCVGRVEARTPTTMAAAPTTLKVEPVAIAPATELREETEPARAPADPEKEIVAPAVAKKPTPAATTTSSSSKASLNLKPATRPAERRIYGDNSPVHGGLSSPGF